MSQIIKYDFNTTRSFMNTVEKQYVKGMTEGLPFEDWKCMAYPNMYEHPESFRVVPWELGKEIRVAPPATEMLKIIKAHEQEAQKIELYEAPERQSFLKTQLYKKILKPTHEFTVNEPFTIKGELEGKQIDVPIWFNSTLKGVNVRLGFDKLDSSLPSSIPLSDAPVHAMLGGITGSGKSVALNDIICSLLLEYAPWELSLVLADFKIVELSRYANRIPTPHVKIVAATGSLEFALSTFKYLIDEMNARQEVFTACGVQNIKDFRTKFNLCLPRILLVADEFVQMYENVKESEQKGNDKAAELKQSINSAISAVARLGRSQGIHMLLSSQNMDGVLDEQTAGQFGAGATLASTPAVSKTLIGNPAGATIRGKGKAYINLNKNEKSVKDNILVRVPYIDGDDPPEEEAAKGKMSYLQTLLKELYDRAQSVGWTSVPYYYNENNAIPKQLFYEALAEAMEYMQTPDEGDEISNEIYKNQIFARIPLGREIAYTTQKAYPLSLRYKQGHNLLINADDNIIKTYITKLIGEALSYFANKFVIVSTDEALYQQTKIKQFADDRPITSEIYLTGGIPERYLKMTAKRHEYLQLQGYLTTNTEDGLWNDEKALEFVYKGASDPDKPEFELITQTLVDKYANLVNMDLETTTKELFPTLEEQPLNSLKKILGKFVSYRKGFYKMTNGFKTILGAKSFERIVIWWIGAENIPGIKDYNLKPKLTAFLDSSCQVGIFNVLVPSLIADPLADMSMKCNYVMEKCSKEFFMAVNLPRHININKNSYGVHDRELKTHNLLRVYS